MGTTARLPMHARVHVHVHVHVCMHVCMCVCMCVYPPMAAPIWLLAEADGVT